MAVIGRVGNNHVSGGNYAASAGTTTYGVSRLLSRVGLRTGDPEKFTLRAQLLRARPRKALPTSGKRVEGLEGVDTMSNMLRGALVSESGGHILAH